MPRSRALKNGWPLVAGQAGAQAPPVTPPPPATNSAMLREDGSYLLREDGSRMLREAA